MPDHQGRECSCAEDAFFHARRIVHDAARYLSVIDDRWVVRVRTAEDNAARCDDHQHGNGVVVTMLEDVRTA